VFLTPPGESFTEFQLPLGNIPMVSIPRDTSVQIAITAVRTSKFPSKAYLCNSVEGYDQKKVRTYMSDFDVD
jgi:hypothetical protein